MRWAGHVTSMREMSRAYNIIKKPEGKSSLGIPTCRWEDVEVDFKEIGETLTLSRMNRAQNLVKLWVS
jgi:hypothetical protein